MSLIFQILLWVGRAQLTLMNEINYILHTMALTFVGHQSKDACVPEG
jgi:hypothetical protein